MFYLFLYSNFNIIFVLLWGKNILSYRKDKTPEDHLWHLYLHIRTGQPVKILEKEKTTNIQLKEIIVSNYILSVLFALESKNPIITTSTTMVNKICLWSSDLPKKELKKKKIHSEPFCLVLQNNLK